MWLMLIVLLPFLGSLCVAFLPSNSKNWEAWLAGLVAAASTVITLCYFPTIASNEVATLRYEWLPTYGLNFSLRMDGFAWLFSLLVSGKIGRASCRERVERSGVGGSVCRRRGVGTGATWALVVKTQ